MSLGLPMKPMRPNDLKPVKFAITPKNSMKKIGPISQKR